jgi:hypothetical protein
MINHYLKLSPDELKQTYLFFARCSLSEQLEIMIRHAPLFHKYRSINEHQLLLHELSYIALTKAIRSLMADMNSIRKKNYGEMTLDEIEKLSEMKIRHFYNNNADLQLVRDKLIQKWPLVVSLRLAPTKYGNKPLSFRKLALLLKKELNLDKLAASTVCELWTSLEKTNKGQKDA